MHYRKTPLCRLLAPVGKGINPVGKGFADRKATWQSAKPGSAKADLPTATWHTVGKAFANCHASSRHSHVAPSALTAGFADCWFLGSRQRIFFSKIVCRLAASSAVGKERKYFFFEMFFADCFRSCSRQRFDLFADCLPLQSAKTLSWGFFAQLCRL